MTTFNFNTKNKYIDGKIDYYTDSRDSDSYRIHYSVSLRRNNGWTGTATHGNMSYNVYVNGTSIYSSSYSTFTVPNGGAWVVVISGYKDISLDAFSSATHTIGFSSSGAVEGLQADYQYTSYSVGSYRTATGVSTIEEIKDNMNNTFTIRTRTGNGGNNNPANDCHVYGTVNGTTPNYPNWGNYHFVYNCGGTKTNNTYSKAYTLDELGVAWDIKVGAKPYTIGDYGGNNMDGDVKWADIKYYTSPISQPSPEMSFYKDIECTKLMDKLTPKSFIKVTWDKAQNGNINSQNNGCRFYLFIKRYGQPNWESYGYNLNDDYNGSGVPYNYFDIYYHNMYVAHYEINNNKEVVSIQNLQNNKLCAILSAKNMRLKKGDIICVGVQPFHWHLDTSYQNYWWVSPISVESSQETTQNSATIWLKIDNNTMVECQPYIKVNNTSDWKESTNLYVNVFGDNWEEST